MKTPVFRIALLTLSISLFSGGYVFADKLDNNGNHFGQIKNAKVCDSDIPGMAATCHSRVVVDSAGAPKTNALPTSGLSPAQLHGAYTSQTTASANTIIAIVDAYDNPNAYNDLNTYSKTYGIPTLTQCSGSITNSATPCFQKINQRGGSQAPSYNQSWALEIALDVQVAHAMCQNCSILLVEADTNSYADLIAAEDMAYAKGAKVVSNSWGSSEWSGETSFDSHFNHPGVATTFSTGDAGYGVQYPAASPYVTAVGGTTLTMQGTIYGGESAWSGAGSGCSAFESKLPWQTDSLCNNRTVADVSAVADPATGVAVYVTGVGKKAKGSWYQVGGTSLASPLIAGIYALSGNTAGAANSLPYANVSALHDIVGGSNGSCGATYLCTGMTGFDGPTGLGTPNGLLAF